MDVSKSTSGDIPTRIIKESIDAFSNNITDCLNASINDCLFPASMKLGDITPVFKSDDKTNKENYRPICTLKPFSKVFERILCDQINSFMNNLLSEKLCGFRKGYKTQYCLIELLETCRKHLDNKNISGMILCDLSKAFDTLPHDLLRAKLEACGFGMNALKFIYSYLKARKQRCKVISFFSTWLEIL